MKKWTGIIVALLLVIAAGLFSREYLAPEQKIRRSVARIGSEITGAEVRLERATISQGDGTGVIIGFTLSNPQRYGGLPAIAADTIKFALEPETLQRDVPTLRTIAVVSPRIRYAVDGNGSNLSALLEQIQRAKPSMEARIIVDRLVIRDARLQIESPATTPAMHPADIALPEIRLSNLGRESGGITGTQLATVVLESLLFHVRRALPPARPATPAGQPLPK